MNDTFQVMGTEMYNIRKSTVLDVMVEGQFYIIHMTEKL